MWGKTQAGTKSQCFLFFVFNSSLNILMVTSQHFCYLETLHYLKVGRDKYWMLPRELGKCFPYSKVPPRVCSRKSRDKGADAAFGGNWNKMQQLEFLEQSQTTDKSDKSSFRIWRKTETWKHSILEISFPIPPGEKRTIIISKKVLFTSQAE